MAGRCLTHAGGPVWGRCQQGEGRGAVLPGPSVDGGLIRQPPVLIVRGTPGWRSGTGTALLGAISRFGGSGDLRVFEHGCECVNWWQRVGVSAGLRGMPGGGVPLLGWLLSRGDQPAAGDGARARTKKFADPEDAPAPYPVREDDQRAHRPQQPDRHHGARPVSRPRPRLRAATSEAWPSCTAGAEPGCGCCRG